MPTTQPDSSTQSIVANSIITYYEGSLPRGSIQLNEFVCICVLVLSSSGSKMLVHFVNQSGVKSSVFVTEGETLLDVVIKKNLDISGFGNKTFFFFLLFFGSM